MAREILPNDIPKIKSLLNLALQTEDYADISRMGGLTNHTYKITLKNEFRAREPKNLFVGPTKL